MQSNKRHKEELKTQCNSEMKLLLEFGIVREDCIKEVGLEKLEGFERENEWGGNFSLGKAFTTEVGILMAYVEVVRRNT